jgi:hypothetical protein
VIQFLESSESSTSFLQILKRGVVIPATPLALDVRRQFDDRRQRALIRYYAAAGAGGLAVGVHTTQFEIRDAKFGLYRPVLQLAAEEIRDAELRHKRPFVRVAGICGETTQAISEATIAVELGYQVGLLSLASFRGMSHDLIISHCRKVADVIPLFGFYLQPTVGGVNLPYRFWREFLTIERVLAIKVAPFNRYRTLDVVRAVAESGRNDVAVYTGNDDNIVLDLLTPYRFRYNSEIREVRMVGGLLGHWAIWTREAVRLLEHCHQVVEDGGDVPLELLAAAAAVTDCNAAVFDAAHDFRGCIPGIHEVLRRQGLLEGNWCLDERVTLSPGQADAIERVANQYPHVTDDKFVAEHLSTWLDN